MECKLEAIRQQLLQHSLPLLIVGLAWRVGLRGDVEFICVDPCRRTHNLLGMQPISKCKETAEWRVDGCKFTASHPGAPALRVGITWLDGSYLKLGGRIRRHGWQLRRRFRNRPGRRG